MLKITQRLSQKGQPLCCNTYSQRPFRLTIDVESQLTCTRLLDIDESALTIGPGLMAWLAVAELGS